MQVAGPDIVLTQVVGQLLSQTLGESCHQRTVPVGNNASDLIHDISHLPLDGPDFHHWVQQAGGANDLLDGSFRMLQLVVSRGGRDEDHILHVLLELCKIKRPVVITAGQPEAVVHQAFFTGAVALIHGTKLWKRLVALIDDEQKVLWKIVQQAVGRLIGLATVEMTGIVLDALAASCLLNHLHVMQRALLQPVGFNHP